MSSQDTPPSEEISPGVEAQIVADRRQKLERIREAGGEPYPHRFSVSHQAAALQQRYSELPAGEETGDVVHLAGRLMGRRGHGKAMFADLEDRSGRIQLHVTLDRLGDEAFAAFGDLDIGDWIGVEGAVMRSRRGELSIAVASHDLLAKCLRPLPEKWHGLTDVETRLSRRYLDLAVNEPSRATFLLRSRLISQIRRFLDDEGFVEVETPILQPIYGGAAARPFVTHHNELDQELFLRIATELYLKRLVVGGLERVYEIGRNFRNEGVSFKHNPEFTMIEWYQAYADYRDVMELFERMVDHVARGALGTTTIQVGEHEISLAAPWKRETLRDAILQRAGVDILEADETTLRERLQREGVDTTNDRTWAQLVDALLTKFVEPQLIQPTFLTDYPVELSPFAKRHPHDPRLVERFEGFAGGMEICNAFSEINDPADQHERFLQQAAAQQAGDDTAEQMDDDYVRALEYGMPPTGGLGMGIDRFTMLCAGATSIREVILFPARRRQV